MRREAMVEEELTFSVIGAFFEVYNHLGFGFLEHIYIKALERELISRGHQGNAIRGGITAALRARSKLLQVGLPACS